MPPPASSESTASHGVLRTLAVLAPLGVLDASDNRALATHLRAGCEACEGGLAGGWRAIDVLAAATPIVEPSSQARAKLLAAVRSDENVVPLRPRPGAPRAAWLIAAGLAALSLGAGTLGMQELTRLREASRALADEKSALEREQTDLERSKRDLELAISGLEERAGALASRNAVLENAVEVAGGPEMKSVELSGESEFQDAHLRVLIDPALEQVVMLGQKLPPPPPGLTYQLWVVEDGHPSSLGTFAPDDHGRALQLQRGLLDWPSRRVFAVSVEPEGGVLKPSGPVVLSGG